MRDKGSRGWPCGLSCCCFFVSDFGGAKFDREVVKLLLDVGVLVPDEDVEGGSDMLGSGSMGWNIEFCEGEN